MRADAANTKSVDLLNIGLIFISLVAAFKIPFHLFLFSYAVLGPLHYVTEINWLGQKNYFVKERKWIWVFVVMAVLFSVPAFVQLPTLQSFDTVPYIGSLLKQNIELFFSIVSFSLLFAVTLVYVKEWRNILVLLLLNLSINIAVFKYDLFSFALLGVFVPTLVHVYLFTLLFMFYGTLKSRNMAGYIGCAFLLLCPFLIWGSVINTDDYQVSDAVQSMFLKSNFQNVVTSSALYMGAAQKGGSFMLLSEIGIKIQIFLAFGYTYHYLNWFSKTSIIGWGKNLSRKKLILLVIIWILSLALYQYDYQVGLTALLILSMIHVFFELPLNVQSVTGIVSSVFKREK